MESDQSDDFIAPSEPELSLPGGGEENALAGVCKPRNVTVNIEKLQWTGEAEKERSPAAKRPRQAEPPMVKL